MYIVHLVSPPDNGVITAEFAHPSVPTEGSRVVMLDLASGDVFVGNPMFNMLLRTDGTGWLLPAEQSITPAAIESGARPVSLTQWYGRASEFPAAALRIIERDNLLPIERTTEDGNLVIRIPVTDEYTSRIVLSEGSLRPLEFDEQAVVQQSPDADRVPQSLWPASTETDIASRIEFLPNASLSDTQFITQAESSFRQDLDDRFGDGQAVALQPSAQAESAPLDAPPDNAGNALSTALIIAGVLLLIVTIVAVLRARGR